MDGKVFLARYPDGRERVLASVAEFSSEQFVEGRWVDFDDPRVRDAEWGALAAEEIET